MSPSPQSDDDDDDERDKQDSAPVARIMIPRLLLLPFEDESYSLRFSRVS